ncbi:hypothetical protein HAX54_037009 [Datura stramonium]|uniref:Uncharacterized protein n=1 Tax=Datura stramonium TaxID=4076 RepID=A0ABS8VKZ5_DATST|nr:hypothetical protein [Datura stramonium]
MAPKASKEKGVASSGYGECNLNIVMEFLANLDLMERFGPRFDEPLDDVDAIDEERARVNSDLESDDDEDDSEMGEVALALIDDED